MHDTELLCGDVSAFPATGEWIKVDFLHPSTDTAYKNYIDDPGKVLFCADNNRDLHYHKETGQDNQIPWDSLMAERLIQIIEGKAANLQFVVRDVMRNEVSKNSMSNSFSVGRRNRPTHLHGCPPRTSIVRMLTHYNQLFGKTIE